MSMKCFMMMRTIVQFSTCIYVQCLLNCADSHSNGVGVERVLEYSDPGATVRPHQWFLLHSVILGQSPGQASLWYLQLHLQTNCPDDFVYLLLRHHGYVSQKQSCPCSNVILTEAPAVSSRHLYNN